MYVLYLNPLYYNAIVAHGLPFKDVVNLDIMNKLFSYDDLKEMTRETFALTKTIELAPYGLTPVVFQDSKYTESDLALIEETRVKLANTIFDCIPVSENTVILYANSSSTQSKQSTIENVFNALALIMSVNKVLSTNQYQQYLHSSNVINKG